MKSRAVCKRRTCFRGLLDTDSPLVGLAVYFQTDSVTWIDANTLEVRPAAEYSDKVRDRFVVKLSEVAK